MELQEAVRINAAKEEREAKEREAAEVAYQARQAELAARQEQLQAEHRARGREQAKKTIAALEALVRAGEDVPASLEIPVPGSNGYSKLNVRFSTILEALRAKLSFLKQRHAEMA